MKITWGADSLEFSSEHMWSQESMIFSKHSWSFQCQGFTSCIFKMLSVPDIIFKMPFIFFILLTLKISRNTGYCFWIMLVKFSLKIKHDWAKLWKEFCFGRLGSYYKKYTALGRAYTAEMLRNQWMEHLQPIVDIQGEHSFHSAGALLKCTLLWSKWMWDRKDLVIIFFLLSFFWD